MRFGKSCVLGLLLAFSAAPLIGQGFPADSLNSPAGAQDPAQGNSGLTSKPQADADEVKPDPDAGPPDRNSKDKSETKQSKRILWIIPSYQAVSADTQLPPMTVKGKFELATRDSFDYSSFALAGIIATEGEGTNSTPEFHGGAAGFGRYFWHASADLTVGNFFTEAIVPTVAHEDPRYYALGHGGFLRRTGYALSRCLITRTDSGNRTLNFSEIIGNGLGAGASDLYYPRQDRTWSQTGQKWVLQIGIDAVFDFGMEFWPDVDHHVFHNRF